MKEFTLTPELAEKLDTFAPSPSDRAAIVWSVISPELKDKIIVYDLSCFCISFLALQAQNEMSFMLDTMKRTSSVFHYAHYLQLWLQHKDELENAKVEGGDNGNESPLPRSEGTTIIKDSREQTEP